MKEGRSCFTVRRLWISQASCRTRASVVFLDCFCREIPWSMWLSEVSIER